MYINIHLRGRRTGKRYRLQPRKTDALRQRADYPRPAPMADGPSPAAPDHKWSRRRPHTAAARRLLQNRLRTLAAGLALSALLILGGGMLLGHRTPELCRETDLAPLSMLTATEAPVSDDAPRTVYLTFDDGPSEYTEQLLATLKEAGVPATFFVIAAEHNEEYLPLLQQMLADGHCIGLHSRTHEYRKIYASAEAYWADIQALQQAIAPWCGDYQFKVLRFPGGSSNTVSHKYGGSGLMEQLMAEAAQQGYTVVDWNVSAEDSVGGDPSANTIASRVIRGCRDKQHAIVLMHDSSINKATLEALPTIIQWLQENDYTFDTVDHLPEDE